MHRLWYGFLVLAYGSCHSSAPCEKPIELIMQRAKIQGPPHCATAAQYAIDKWHATTEPPKNRLWLAMAWHQAQQAEFDARRVCGGNQK